MIRLFAALEVPPEIADDLASRQQGVPGARWRPVDSLHITLRFFGDIPEDVAAELDGELARIPGKPFEVALEGAGHFGEGARLGAIWAGVKPSEPLALLASRCEAAARRARLKPDGRNFKPHVTLAYLKGRADRDRVAAWIAENSLLASPPWRATWFGLYSSWRSAEGTRYDLERDYPLL